MSATIHRTAGSYEVYVAGMIYRAGSMGAAKKFCRDNGYKIVWEV